MEHELISSVVDWLKCGNQCRLFLCCFLSLHFFKQNLFFLSLQSLLFFPGRALSDLYVPKLFASVRCSTLMRAARLVFQIYVLFFAIFYLTALFLSLHFCRL